MGIEWSQIVCVDPETKKKIQKRKRKKQKERDVSGKKIVAEPWKEERNASKWREACEGQRARLRAHTFFPRSTLHMGGDSGNTHTHRDTHTGTHPVCAHLGLTG